MYCHDNVFYNIFTKTILVPFQKKKKKKEEKKGKYKFYDIFKNWIKLQFNCFVTQFYKVISFLSNPLMILWTVILMILTKTLKYLLMYSTHFHNQFWTYALSDLAVQ